MRVYIAGFYTSGSNSGILDGQASTEFAEISAGSNPDWVLESFHYLTANRTQTIRKLGRSIFADSGAFTMFTQGITVDLQGYADWLKANADIVHVASNLDEIGAGKEEQTYANQKSLEGMGVKVQPVFHARDQDIWLKRYLDEGYDYILLGGMVPESTQYLTGWLDRLWDKYLLTKSGKPKVKVHGFGLTVLELMTRYPWFSVDSTSWVLTSRFGGIYLDFPGGHIIKLKISDRSPSKEKFDQHFDSLSRPDQQSVIQRVEELGFKVDDLRVNYGWRDRFNIEFFKRMHAKPYRPGLIPKGLLDD